MDISCNWNQNALNKTVLWFYEKNANSDHVVTLGSSQGDGYSIHSTNSDWNRTKLIPQENLMEKQVLRILRFDTLDYGEYWCSVDIDGGVRSEPVQKLQFNNDKGWHNLLAITITVFSIAFYLIKLQLQCQNI